MSPEEFAAYKRSKRLGYRYRGATSVIEMRAVRDECWQRYAWARVNHSEESGRFLSAVKERRLALGEELPAAKRNVERYIDAARVTLAEWSSDASFVRVQPLTSHAAIERIFRYHAGVKGADLPAPDAFRLVWDYAEDQRANGTVALWQLYARSGDSYTAVRLYQDLLPEHEESRVTRDELHAVIDYERRERGLPDPPR